MKQFLILTLGLALTLGLPACSDDDDDPISTAERLEGIWHATATIGHLGNTGVGSGSLAGDGWNYYTLGFSPGAHFFVTGDLNDVSIILSGTFVIDDEVDPMEIDLTITNSTVEDLFSMEPTIQPLQEGIFELNAANTELTIQWGMPSNGVPRPTAFLLDANGANDCGTLVKK